MRPGAIVLTVTPSGPSSRASVFSQPTTPGRTAFERARFVEGLAHGRRLDRDDPAVPALAEVGKAGADERDVGREQQRHGLLDASAVSPTAGPAGGPPPFRTSTSSPPKAPTVAWTRRSRCCGIGEVALDGESAEPFGLALEQVAPAPEHRDVRALGGERLGNREAHARRGAADDRRPAAEPEVHRRKATRVCSAAVKPPVRDLPTRWS